jgi:hypothetical protein
MRARTKLRAIAAAVLLAACLPSCQNAFENATGSAGTICVDLGSSFGKKSKTILPHYLSQVSSIEVTVSSGGSSQTQTATSTSGELTFSNLEIGTWTISAIAFKGTAQIGAGTTTATVSAGSSQSISLPLSFTGDGSSTGDLSINISWPTSSGASIASWELDTSDGNYVDGDQIATSISEGSYIGSIGENGLAPGSYTLFLWFYDSNWNDKGSYIEKVNILAGLTSDGWIDGSGNIVSGMSFASSDLFDSTATLASLTVNGATLDAAFAATTYAYSITDSPANIAVGISSGASGQSISYSWNGTAGAWATSSDSQKTTVPLALSTTTANVLVISVTSPDRLTTSRYVIGKPFHITSAAGLTAIANELDGSYVLDQDIDAGAWAPIAQNYGMTIGYSGTFDGKGHTITYTINSASGCLGLFGNILAGGTVKNLNVVCAIVSTYDGDGYIGGIAGQNMGTIIHCSTSGTLTAAKGNYVGGLVGQNGRATYPGTIQECFSTVDVTANSQSGGLVGVQGENDSTYTHSTITNCYARGTVTGSSNGNFGGLVGINRTSGEVVRCYATGAVTGTSIGGLVGSGSGTITASFYNNEVFTGATVNGTGLTTAKMKVAANYTGWDFTDVWGIDTATPINDGYPYILYIKNNTTVYD